MQIKKEKPKIYDTLHEKFGIDWEDGFAIAYGDTVYSKNDLRPDLKVHEQVHLDQQNVPGMSPELWWKRYIDEDSFRLGQETEAYQAQVEFFRKNTQLMSRNSRRAWISRLAEELSGSTYGFIIDYKKALELIKS